LCNRQAWELGGHRLLRASIRAQSPVVEAKKPIEAVLKEVVAMGVILSE
jgi:hypothetical protein